MGRKANVTPNEVSYSAVIHAYAQKGDPEGAQLCLEEMRKANATPDEFSYNAVIKAHVNFGNIEGAEKWLSLLQKDLGVPSCVSFCTALCCDAASPHDVTRIVQEMQSAGVVLTHAGYRIACLRLVLSGREELAIDLYRAAIKLQVLGPLWREGDGCVDLHRLPRVVAELALTSILEDMIGVSSKDTAWAKHGLTIDCGMGRHSRDGVPILRPAIHKFLTDKGLLCEDEGLHFHVPATSLLAWVAAQ